MSSPELFVQPCFSGQYIELSIKCDSGWCVDAEYKKIAEGMVPPHFLQVSDLEAQALMDRLWKAGFRPTEGSGSAGALSATEHHLSDMRKLVFEK
jgi:hypothetical protein